MISVEIHDLIVQEVKKEFPEAEILLFGSRALGNEHPYSDYDIYIIQNSEAPVAENRQKSSRVRRSLAFSGVDADIIVTNPDYYRSTLSDKNSLAYQARHYGVSL